MLRQRPARERRRELAVGRRAREDEVDLRALAHARLEPRVRGLGAIAREDVVAIRGIAELGVDVQAKAPSRPDGGITREELDTMAASAERELALSRPVLAGAQRGARLDVRALSLAARLRDLGALLDRGERGQRPGLRDRRQRASGALRDHRREQRQRRRRPRHDHLERAAPSIARDHDVPDRPRPAATPQLDDAGEARRAPPRLGRQRIARGIGEARAEAQPPRADQRHVRAPRALVERHRDERGLVVEDEARRQRRHPASRRPPLLHHALGDDAGTVGPRVPCARR